MRRYETLDALRGIAALSVVIYHLHIIGLTSNIVPHGYLAVDFFFVLSGFVMAYAYQRQLLDGLSWRSFTSRRIVRIYPLALAGAALGVVVAFIEWRLRPQNTDGLPSLIVSSLLNLLLLPDFFSGPKVYHKLFPANGALWSLFFEVSINLIWAWIGVRLSTKSLAAVASLSALGLVSAIIHSQTANLGWDIYTIAGGAARVCFSFTVGLIIYRLHLTIDLPVMPFNASVLSGILIFLLVAPFALDDQNSIIWDIVCVLFAFPASIMIGVGQGRNSRVGNFLGQISYPLYALHYPILLVFFLAQHVVADRVGQAPFAVAGTFLSVGGAWLALRLYDEPARAWLSARLFGQAAISSTGSARTGAPSGRRRC